MNLEHHKWTLFIIGCCILLFHSAFLMIHYKDLPQIIPTHIKLNGEVDGYGDKTLVFLELVINLALLGLIFVVINKPHWANYPTTLSAGNEKKMHLRMQKVLGGFSIVISLLFFVITLNAFKIHLFNVPIFILLFVSIIGGLIYLNKSVVE